MGGWGFNETTSKYETNPKYTWQNTGWPQTDRHPVVNVKHVEKYEQRMPKEKEAEVRRIKRHEKKGRYYRYLVQWVDGDETWEKARSFIDHEGDEVVINDKLEEYWRERPDIRAKEGY